MVLEYLLRHSRARVQGFAFQINGNNDPFIPLAIEFGQAVGQAELVAKLPQKPHTLRDECSDSP
ncbi:hypothetical protein BRCON_0269 [Candidatus Sumerlaea chitinivorans]|uniref:Uncharacterized protein n=1 Tax=Sumerlaea chitinivorans TaxID=2250252 RepID=A0A2Z4Y2A6_SUMC1|nr:hypothetical protein BRCON_0269 [Candidatus Sumerlaea chitinivorans]